MQKISFYPGPSKVYPQVSRFMQDAYKNGILSINHRGSAFIEISQKAIELVKSKLHVPEDYTVLYAVSATECWEIIRQSLVKRKSLHIYNGSFGERSYMYSRKQTSTPSQIIPYPFGIENKIDLSKISVADDVEAVFICQNETSNGTAIDNESLWNLRKNYPEQLIAVDVTSSLSGVFLDFAAADIWYASVQKCFGLPAGLALMILSPQAIERAKELNINCYYNSLTALLDRIADYQTTYTPNVLNIYLLMRVMEMVKDIQGIHQQTIQRARNYYQFLAELKHFTPLIENPVVRSQTVIAVKGEPFRIQSIKNRAIQAGIVLGNGYGKWKDDTFRIANFPAIDEKEIKRLLKFLKKVDDEIS